MWKWWRTSHGYCTLCALAAIAAFLYMAFSIEPRLEVAMPQYQQHGTKNAADQQTNQAPNHGQHRETFWEWTTKDAAGFYTLLLAGVTVILAIVAGVQAVMFFWQLKLMREGINDAKTAADAAKMAAQAGSTSAAAQTQMATGMARPRIRARQFDLDPLYEGRTPFKAGEPIYGRFSIVNIGGSVARIVIWRCHLLIGQEGGPPNWPLTVNPDPESDQFEAVHPILDTGVHTDLRFKSRFCATDIDEMNLSSFVVGVRLYVIGRLTYEDENKVVRTTGFCRYWTMRQGTNVARFYRIDDLDYEYED